MSWRSRSATGPPSSWETFLWTFTFQDDFEPKFRMPFRMMRGPLGFVAVQVLNMMIKKVIPEHCPITDEGLQHYLTRCRPCARGGRCWSSFVSICCQSDARVSVGPVHGS
jgi:hypothetical protein